MSNEYKVPSHHIKAFETLLDANNYIEDFGYMWEPISIADNNRYLTVLFRFKPND